MASGANHNLQLRESFHTGQAVKNPPSRLVKFKPLLQV